MGFMCIQITKHKARLLTWGMHFLGIFSLLSLGHWRTRKEHYSFMSYLASFQGHLNFGIFLVGINFLLLFFPPLLPWIIAGSWGSLQEALRGTSCFFNHSLATVPFIGLLGNHILGLPSYQLIDFFPLLRKRKKTLDGNKDTLVAVRNTRKDFSLKSSVRRNVEFCGMLVK